MLKLTKNIYGKNNNVLKPFRNKIGYNIVYLIVNGKKHNKRVHRLVASAFIDNPLNKEKCEKYQRYANMHLKTGPRKLYYIPERYFP